MVDKGRVSGMGRWTQQQVAEALTLASATSIREASRRTGVPLATLHRWCRAAGVRRAETVRDGGTGRGETGRVGENLAVMGEQVRSRAVAAATEKVTEALADRLLRLADRLYAMADRATTKVELAIADPDELPPGRQPLPRDRDGAAWGRFLVGVLAQAIEKAQLLAGRPTERSEVLSGDQARRAIAERIACLAAAEGAGGDHQQPH